MMNANGRHWQPKQPSVSEESFLLYNNCRASANCSIACLRQIIKKVGKELKGTVVATWVQTARNLWGKDTTEQAMKKVGWEPDRLFTPTEDVEDAKPKAFAAELAAAL